MKKRLLFVFICLSLATPGISQSDVADWLKFGKDDAGKLIEAYVNPYANALGIGLNNSWYNTAETHKILGFDLAFTISAVQIPKSDQTFDVNSLNLTNARVATGYSNIAATAAGNEKGGTQLDIYSNDTKISSFKTPGGSELDLVPIPMIQLGVGILPHTELIGRYVPTIKFDVDDDRAKIGLVGVGLKHNFKEWIPVVKHLPFDASVFAGYTQIDGESGLTFSYENYGLPNPIGYVPDENQRADVKTKAMKYGLILSKKVAVLTFFAGVSHNTSKSTIDLLGKYPVFTINNLGIPEYAEEDHPIALKFKNSSLAADAGFRLKLAFFSLFGSVNFSEYTSYNAGLSFGFR
ncbi:DUF6588 family protein [Gaoshiqia sp. Z1-71]|uniref:DUF6588 family protein n=1 Tax=Gaoshiqia hydrogeniformans TaxID=3290090 RepID=UPI003BF772ED